MPPVNFVFFGDSLSDDGNLFDITDGVLPDLVRNILGGPTNAVSDGPTYATYSVELLGLDSANYAVAAAQAAGERPLGELLDSFGISGLIQVPADDPRLDFDINLSAQIDRFQDDTIAQNLADTTAMILIGGNDYGALDPGAPNAEQVALDTVNAVIASISQATMDLLDSGVYGVVLATLPPVTFFPDSNSLSPAELDLASEVFELHNTLLTETADALRDDGHYVHIIETDGIARALEDDPSSFGIIAPFDDTLQDSDVLDDFDPDQVAFYDALHPSTAMHGVFGAATAKMLQGHASSGSGSGTDGHIFTRTDGDDAWFNAGAGDDVVLGLAGNDLLLGGSGDDAVFGGSGNDGVTGQGGQDIVSGGSGDDNVIGSFFEGLSVLDGGQGDDLVLSGRQADVLIDGIGSDVMIGQNGDDTFIYTQASLIGGTDGVDQDRFFGGAGTDTLYVVLDTPTFAALGGDLGGGNPDAALASLRIGMHGIENVVALDGRAALSVLDGEVWYAEADLWGLI